MKINSPLYHPLFKLLGQSKAWADLRHLQTFCWMVIGLICSGWINLTCWSTYTESRAQWAQSHQRRFSRWLHNNRINVHRLYKPIIKASLANWDSSVIKVIEDTTLLWNQYCLVRLSVQYRGRAVVLGWRVLEQSSSSVTLEDYQDLLRPSAKLLPPGVKVIFLADRGFADTKLMRFVTQELNWNHRIRLKSNAWIYRQGYGWKQLRDFHLGRGEAWLMQNVKLTKTHKYGWVHLALARDPISGELWKLFPNMTFNGRFDPEPAMASRKQASKKLEREFTVKSLTYIAC